MTAVARQHTNERTGKLQDKTPMARCHDCGLAVVSAVCCWCHALMCAKHDGVANLVDPRWLLRQLRLYRRRRYTNFAPPEDEVVDADDGDLPEEASLADRQEAPTPSETNVASTPATSVEAPSSAGSTHVLMRRRRTAAKTPSTSGMANRYPTRRSTERHYCRNCMPLARAYDAEILAATLTALLGLSIYPLNSLIGGLLVISGSIRIVIRLLIARRRAQRKRSQEDRQRLRLQLDPRLRKVTIVETLNGNITLDDDHKYRAEITGHVTGKSSSIRCGAGLTGCACRITSAGIEWLATPTSYSQPGRWSFAVRPRSTSFRWVPDS